MRMCGSRLPCFMGRRMYRQINGGENVLRNSDRLDLSLNGSARKCGITRPRKQRLLIFLCSLQYSVGISFTGFLLTSEGTFRCLLCLLSIYHVCMYNVYTSSFLFFSLILASYFWHLDLGFMNIFGNSAIPSLKSM